MLRSLSEAPTGIEGARTACAFRPHAVKPASSVSLFYRRKTRELQAIFSGVCSMVGGCSVGLKYPSPSISCSPLDQENEQYQYSYQTYLPK